MRGVAWIGVKCRSIIAWWYGMDRCTVRVQCECSASASAGGVCAWRLRGRRTGAAVVADAVYSASASLRGGMA